MLALNVRYIETVLNTNLSHLQVTAVVLQDQYCVTGGDDGTIR